MTKRAAMPARFVTNEVVINRAGIAVAARFVTKVTKLAAMPARFVTNEVVTNRERHCAFFLSLGYQ